jgi:hypothetical protein
LKTDCTVPLIGAPELQGSSLLSDGLSEFSTLVAELDAVSRGHASKTRRRQNMNSTKFLERSGSGAKGEKLRDGEWLEDVVRLKTAIVTLLLLEKDCIRFYPVYSRGYLSQVNMRLNSPSTAAAADVLARLHGADIMTADKVLLRDVAGLLEGEVAALHEALGYTGVQSCDQIPRPFIEADPSLFRHFDLDDDGFEIIS